MNAKSTITQEPNINYLSEFDATASMLPVLFKSSGTNKIGMLMFLYQFQNDVYGDLYVPATNKGIYVYLCI